MFSQAVCSIEHFTIYGLEHNNKINAFNLILRFELVICFKKKELTNGVAATNDNSNGVGINRYARAQKIS